MNNQFQTKIVLKNSKFNYLTKLIKECYFSNTLKAWQDLPKILDILKNLSFSDSRSRKEL